MHDLRSAVRALRATPVVSLVAILSLALAIGACTALFSILDSLLLRPLPVREPATLAALHDSIGNSFWSHTRWEQVRARTALFAGTAAASGPQRLNASQTGRMDPIDALYVSGRFFDLLGVPAVAGRVITDRDDWRGGGADGPVAVLNYAFWQRRYGGAADVIGRSITLDRVRFTIVGVAAPRFFGVAVGSTFDVMVPLGTEPLLRGAGTFLDRPGSSWLNIVVRLKPGQTIEQATSAIRTAQAQIDAAAAGGVASDAKPHLAKPLEFRPAGNGLAGGLGLRAQYRRPIVMLLAAAGLLLLVACANAAHVGLARAAARHHELAVRAALGASKIALARPLLLESLVLAAAGALLGSVIARLGVRALVSAISTPANRVVLDFTLDWRVLAFTIGASSAAAVVFGAGPAFLAGCARPREALAQGGRGTRTGGRGSFSGALVVVQVALSLVLVVSAGLFGRTLGALSRLDPGFDRQRVLIFEFEKSQSATDAGLPNRSLDRVIDSMRAVPGVRLAAASFVTPVSGPSSTRVVKVLGEPPARNAVAYRNVVTPGWFATYGTAVVAGRDFNDHDAAGAAAVAIVNRAFVERFLPGKDPLGRLVVDGPRPPLTIVGVVEDAAYCTLRERPTPTYYTAYAQRGPNPFFATSVSVRSAGPPVNTLVRPLVAAIGAAQPNASFSFLALADQVDATLVRERLLAMLSAFFGGLALVLAALGLYGIAAYSVTRRRGEIGIRIALGGTPRDVVGLVLRRVTWLVGGGVAAGCVTAHWAARLVASLLYGLEPRDPATLAGAAAVLAITGMVAVAVPAWRATRVDPATALRSL